MEDLNFADARTAGRESMGRGRRGRRFRKTVAGIPTAVFRDRLTAQTHRQGIALWAVNPAYTSAWGDQHWRRPYVNVTRHEAAATVIGRRAQGFKARRREGVTRARPEDHAVRAADRAGPQVLGEYREPTPTRDAGKRIPPARPGKNAATGPGNRYPGISPPRLATSVTVEPKLHAQRGAGKARAGVTDCPVAASRMTLPTNDAASRTLAVRLVTTYACVIRG